MIRRTGSMVLGALAVLALASPAAAQSIFFGGGLSLPMGDFKDYAKSGWMMTGGVSFDIGTKGLFFEVEGFFGSNKHEAATAQVEEKTNLFAGIGALGYTFGDAKAKIRPYVLAGAGVLSHQFRTDAETTEGSEKMLAITGAGGLLFALNDKARLWVEARYLTGSKDGSSTTVIPITAGISLTLK